jgi:YesN/AraC family two-component response regulator
VRPARVLVCDDTEDIVLLLSMEFGFDPDIEVVGSAGNGVEAIALAGRLQPDVVLLDLAMPVMDGLQALPEIRRVAPGTKVIVLSGFDAGAMAPKALSRGAIRYLEKGLTPSDIAVVVKQVAGRGNSSSGREPPAPLRFAALRLRGWRLTLPIPWGVGRAGLRVLTLLY